MIVNAGLDDSQILFNHGLTEPVGLYKVFIQRNMQMRNLEIRDIVHFIKNISETVEHLLKKGGE